MEKRKSQLPKAAGLIAIALVAGIIAFAGYEQTISGARTWRDTVIFLSMLTLLASTTWFMVVYTQYETPEGYVTNWKRVGRSALIIWAAMGAMTLMVVLSIPLISPLSNLIQVALFPSFVVFPIWTAVAVFRERRNQKQLTDVVTRPWEAGVAFTRVPEGGFHRGLSAFEQRLNFNRVRFILGMSILILGLVAGLWFTDQWVRSQELNSMLKTVSQTERIMKLFQRQSSETIYGFQQLVDQQGLQAAQSDVLTAYRDSGQKLATNLQVLEAEWEDVNILPWHADLKEFHSDYSRHLTAWIQTGKHYASAGNIKTVASPNPYDSDIVATFQIVKKTGRSIAVPLFADNAKNRIDLIFRN